MLLPASGMSAMKVLIFIAPGGFGQLPLG